MTIKHLLLTISFCIFCISTGFSQSTYFDIYGKETTEKAFHLQAAEHNCLEIERDNSWYLIRRESEGKLSPVIFNKLKSELVMNPEDSSKLIVIQYYPGKDNCNSSGNQKKSYWKSLHNKFNKKITKEYNGLPLYIYKSPEGTEKYGEDTYKPDPNQIVENTFFRYHFPCGSFVVINPNGKYKSYFGEYPTDLIYTYAEGLMK